MIELFSQWTFFMFACCILECLKPGPKPHPSRIKGCPYCGITTHGSCCSTITQGSLWWDENLWCEVAQYWDPYCAITMHKFLLWGHITLLCDHNVGILILRCCGVNAGSSIVRSQHRDPYCEVVTQGFLLWYHDTGILIVGSRCRDLYCEFTLQETLLSLL